MMQIVERVDRLEEMFARFMERTEQMLTVVQEDVSQIRTSSIRTDRNLLEIQRQAEKDRQQAEKDRQLDRQQAEKDRQQAEKDRKDFNRRLAAVTDSQGLMIENMVWPNLKRIAGELFGDEPVITSGIRIKRRRPDEPGENMEIDLLAAGTSRVLVCEAKSRVDAAKAADFLDKLRSFPAFFPEYAGHRVLPMLASIAFEDSVLKHLTSRGIYALGFGDETMELLNAGEIA